MKEFVVTFNLLAEDYEHAKKLSEPICTYFLKDHMCELESVRMKNPEPVGKNSTGRSKANKSKSDKSWLDNFGYTDK